MNCRRGRWKSLRQHDGNPSHSIGNPTHLVVLPVGQVQERLFSEDNAACTLLSVLVDVTRHVTGSHGSVDELGGLAVADTLLLLELVVEGEEEDEGADWGGRRQHDFFSTVKWGQGIYPN